MTAFDEVFDAVPGERAVAVRNVPGTLGVFATHFPRFPVLPGVLILDDIVRAARLAAPELPKGSRWVLAEARRVRYRHFAEPGDRLEISVRVTEATESSVTCKATVSAGGRDITTIRQLRLDKSEVAA
ncbi:3-hydroxyacyl-ACP dehydratase FabZ family protein [Streptomyces sp. NPDC058045]|uniref:3-hydroxyacyl-ACP dehydratase FabZ family protein n=1 Tax=Streptomyces sp. NPDC058045 TaxID=3346311 RepID=UPI0036E862A8